MAAPYILSHKRSEAHAYAQDVLDVPRGYYRIVTSPSSIRGPRGANLYVLPGWERRNDRFSMKTALKFTRLNVIMVEAEPVAEEPPAGPTERDLEVAYRYNALRDLNQEPDGLEPEGFTPYLEPEGWEPPETLNAEQILRLAAGESGAEVAPMEEREQAEEPAPKRTRRRRCPDCGTLVEPEEIEEHRASHLPAEGE